MASVHGSEDLECSLLKSGLQKGWFLSNHRVWVSRWVRLRIGGGALEVHRGRFSRTPRCDRVCRIVCAGGAMLTLWNTLFISSTSVG